MRGILAVVVAGAFVGGALALAAPSPGTAKQAPAKKTTPAKKASPAKAAPAAGGPAAGGPAFVDNTPLTEEQKIVHVLNRLGFGPRPAGNGRPGDVERVRAMGLEKYIAQQLHPERIDDATVEAKLSGFPLLSAPPQQLARMYADSLRQNQLLQRMRAAQAAMPDAAGDAERLAEARRLQQQAGGQIAAGIAQLQMAKVVRAVDSERQLQEVLVDFWSNHFNIDIRKGFARVYKISDDRDVIRPHVLGRFRDLLGASAKSPAMLFYLDNAQSQAPQPVNPRAAQALRRRGGIAAALAPPPGQRTRGGLNENYARELMELHTLGVDGGYTQRDVQEVARCLTGWGIDRATGTFQFSPRRHDNGEKVVLGRRIPAGGGIQDGETVLDLLAAHPSTARYVSRKLCQRFVADEPPPALVERCAAVWKRTDGDLRAVVRTIVTSPEFFSRAAYRQKIKSPFEFAVSSVRALGGTMDLSPPGLRGAAMRSGGARNLVGQGLVGQIVTMGQPLFQHQAPTGYPEDSRKWVSSGALIARLNFALRLTGGQVPGVALPEVASLAGAERDPKALVTQIADRLLHGEVAPATRATLLRQAADVDGADAALQRLAARRLTALVLGAPEFQRR